jgi:hypothetical protein
MESVEKESLMKKTHKVLLLLLIGVLLTCILTIWVGYSPVVDDYRKIYGRENDKEDLEGRLLFAFATALRINHPAAYDMIDPRAKPKLDEWMNTHQAQRCKSIPYVTLIQSGTTTGSKVTLVCSGYNGEIEFIVDNIVIRDMEVVRWGE